MLGYLITNTSGWEIREHEFDEALGKVFPGYKVGDRRDLRNVVMKVYGINEGDQVIGRVDVSYKECETAVLITGKKADDLAQKLVQETGFQWKDN